MKDAKQQILDREYANFNLAVQLENIKTELEASRKNLALAEIVKTDLTERAKVDQLEIQHFKKERSLAVAKEFELQVCSDLNLTAYLGYILLLVLILLLYLILPKVG